jgi:hypothetical protein
MTDSGNGQFAKAKSPRVASVESGSNVKLESTPQSRKQEAAISRTDAGMRIERRDWQTKKADSPRVDSFEPGSNVNLQSSTQLLKQDSDIVSTDAGMQIDWRAAQRSNAHLPTLESFEPGSNVTRERQAQPLKQASEMVSTDAGTQIDASEEYENAPPPRLETRQTGAKLTDLMRLRLKHSSETNSMVFQIVTSPACPK